MSEQRAIAAVEAAGIQYEVTRHGRVSSLQEAAAVRGVEPRQIVKTLVVRRADDDFVLVLVPGDRTFSWPKLRALLGTSRLSMPDPAGAKAATGYERGTITPFGSTTAWPVVVDSSIGGRVSVGGGAQGVALTVQADDLVRVLDAQVADISEDEPADPPAAPQG
jgi:Cys-tRNA(Pro)/Cys-tRNA(Cys) deacylase